MASVPEDLITYLVADGGITEVAGEDIFEGPPEALPVDQVAVTHFAGEEAEDRIMGPSLTPPGVEVARVQVYVRNEVATQKGQSSRLFIDFPL